jgi:hypothetical protein
MNTHYTPGPWEKTPYKQEILAEANARLVEKAPDMEKLLREVTEFLYILDAAFEPGNLEYDLREEIDTLRQYIHEGTP